MYETFFVLSFMNIRFEIYVTFYQNKLFYELFLPSKFTFISIQLQFSIIQDQLKRKDKDEKYNKYIMLKIYTK